MTLDFFFAKGGEEIVKIITYSFIALCLVEIYCPINLRFVITVDNLFFIGEKNLRCTWTEKAILKFLNESLRKITLQQVVGNFKDICTKMVKLGQGEGS